MSTNFLLFPLLFKFSNDMTFLTLLWYSSASIESQFAPPVVGWSLTCPRLSPSSAMQGSEADLPEWVWANLEECKVHCMPMLYRGRHQKMSHGTCFDLSAQGTSTCRSSGRPPWATCGFSPRLLRSPQTTFGYFRIRLWLT